MPLPGGVGAGFRIKPAGPNPGGFCAPGKEGLLGPPCGLGVRDQPTPDTFGAVRRPTSLLQTDAVVGRESRHRFGPPDAANTSGWYNTPKCWANWAVL